MLLQEIKSIYKAVGKIQGGSLANENIELIRTNGDKKERGIVGNIWV